MLQHGSKGRCQWLIWNRSDRLIIFHLRRCPATPLLRRLQGPDVIAVSTGPRLFFILWDCDALGSQGVSHLKLTIKIHYVVHCRSASHVWMSILSHYNDLPAAPQTHHQSAKSDFVGSIMPGSEITLPSSLRIVFFLLVCFIPPEEMHNVTLVLFHWWMGNCNVVLGGNFQQQMTNGPLLHPYASVKIVFLIKKKRIFWLWGWDILNICILSFTQPPASPPPRSYLSSPFSLLSPLGLLLSRSPSLSLQ